MRILVVLVVLMIAGAARPAAACELVRSPFEHREAAVAVADTVAAVVVDRIDDRKPISYVHVTSILAGSATPDTIAIREMTGVGGPKDGCMLSHVQVGKAYIVTLFAEDAKGAGYMSVYAPTTIADTPAERDATMAAIAKHHPVSAWRTTNGIASRLVLDPESKPGELNLYVVVRNLTRSTIEVTRNYWPVSESTACSLWITGPGTVTATKVPIDDKDIATYFGTRPGRYSSYPPPGYTVSLLLPRVTTAEPGWGYKEELGFRYYPIAKHGDYAVSASCPRWINGEAVTTSAVTVRL